MNYLTNLVARQLDEVETLQPRLPSRFEPQSTALHFELAQSPLTDAEPAEELIELDVTDSADSIRMSPVAFSPPPRAEPESAVEDVSQSVNPPTIATPRPGRLENIVVPPPAKAAAEASPRRPSPADLAPIRDESSETETSLSSTVEDNARQMVPRVSPIADRETLETIQPFNESAAQLVQPKAPSAGRVEPPVMSIADGPHVIALKAPSIQPTNIEPTNSAPAKRSRNVATRRHANSGTTETDVEVPERRTPRDVLTRVPRANEPTRRESQNRFALGSSAAPAEIAKQASVEEEHVWDEALPAQQSVQAEGNVEDNKQISVISRIASQKESIRPGVLTVVPKTFPRAPLENLASEQSRETGPIINVSIGRVEVRATTAPVITEPKVQRQEVLSLDDYLIQRVSGGRS